MLLLLCVLVYKQRMMIASVVIHFLQFRVDETVCLLPYGLCDFHRVRFANYSLPARRHRDGIPHPQFYFGMSSTIFHPQLMTMFAHCRLFLRPRGACRLNGAVSRLSEIHSGMLVPIRGNRRIIYASLKLYPHQYANSMNIKEQQSKCSRISQNHSQAEI